MSERGDDDVRLDAMVWIVIQSPTSAGARPRAPQGDQLPQKIVSSEIAQAVKDSF